MRRSTVLSLPLQLGFPGKCDTDSQLAMKKTLTDWRGDVMAVN